MKTHLSFPDRHQNFWQLTSIQSASQSIPGILIGGMLTQQYGAEVAITSIGIGNLILWLIGLGVISMAYQEKTNAIENARRYLGKFSGLLMALVLFIAFLSWYMLEIQTVITTLSPLFPADTPWFSGALGVFLGLVIAALSMGGILLIRKICVIAFPFLLFCVLYAIFSSHASPSFTGHWGFSLSGIISIGAINLSGIVNLPTFFRHSQSRADSILALTLMTVFDVLFQIVSIFTGVIDPSQVLAAYLVPHAFSGALLLAILFIGLSMICLNLTNIYFASASLEAVLPRLTGSKGFLLIGSLGTAIYALLQNPTFMLLLENMADNFLANLGIILLISFLIKVMIKHRPRAFEKLVSTSCWVVGCLISLIVLISNPQNPNLSLTAGISGSMIAFLCIVFCEETRWAMNKLSLLKE